MRKPNKRVRVTQLSLDELRDKVDLEGDSVPFEYEKGLYYEMDFTLIGEMANIKKLINGGIFPPSEKEALEKMLDGYQLDDAERKAYERAIKRLRALCNR